MAFNLNKNDASNSKLDASKSKSDLSKFDLSKGEAEVSSDAKGAFNLSKGEGSSEEGKGAINVSKVGVTPVSEPKKSINVDKKETVTTEQAKAITTPDSNTKGKTKEKSKAKLVYVIGAIALVALAGYFLFPFNSEEPKNPIPESEVVVPTEDGEAINPALNTGTTEDNVVSGDESDVNTLPITSENGQTIEAKKSEQPATTSDTKVKSTQSANENVSGTPTQKVQSNTANSIGNTQSTVTLQNETLEEKAKQVIKGVYGNGMDRKNALGSEYKAIQDKVNELYKMGEF